MKHDEDINIFISNIKSCLDVIHSQYEDLYCIRQLTSLFQPASCKGTSAKKDYFLAYY